MDGFLVQQPFADLIAGGKKTWELRTQPVHLPSQPFYILATQRPHPIAVDYDQGRLGVAVGIAESDGYEGPFTIEDLAHQGNRHRTSLDAIRMYAKGRKLYAMRIVRAKLIPPRRYRTRFGPVTVMKNVEFL